MTLAINIGIFAFISFAASQIGERFKRARLPLITGYLIAGIIAGPYLFDLITKETLTHLVWIDEISLAFIAFAAGSELNITELRGKVKSISWITGGIVVATMALGLVAFLFLNDNIPFMAEMNAMQKFAVALIMASILVARSPSSAIAIIQELRAKGPFTQITLGVTIISDVLVIFLFAFAASVADAIFEGSGLSLGFALLLLLELVLNIVVGYLLSQILRAIMSVQVPPLFKTGLVLVSGYGVYKFSGWLREFTHAQYGFEVLLEPLLVCMIASFVLINFTRHHNEFLTLLHKTGPAIYIAFFTLTGASLELDTLVKTWGIAVALFGARLVGIIAGSFTGGVAARDPMKQNRLYWMAFITQAGVGLGLAKDVAVEFPELGATFSTIAIAVIVLNQIVGPPFHKFATRRIGESHEKAEPAEFDGYNDALIFGLEDQSLALARELLAHDWNVKIAYVPDNGIPPAEHADLQIIPIEEYCTDELEKLDIRKTDTVVTMLTDEENHCLVELIYENYGVENVVVRVNNRDCIDQFHELDALTVHPSTALVNLLEHFVRTPNSVSMLLGSEVEQDREVIELEVRNKDLDGVAVRDLHLPMDALVLQIWRQGETLVSQGYTRLKYKDRVTFLGSQESLIEVTRLFD
jgi:Trk K+ transport system NAD-binding subunit/Kef-type K+ transport system membrane component KefB